MVAKSSRRTGWRLGYVSSLVATALLAGCTNEPAAESSLINEPPYWCELVPKEALVEVQQLEDDEPFTGKEFTAGRMLYRDDYECSVSILDQARLVLRVQVYRGDTAREELPDISSRTDLEPAVVPPRLGQGQASFDEGWVLWRCDQKLILSYLDLRDASAPGREIEPQVIRLLEIAQRRYAELATCDVETPDTTSPPAAAGTRPSEKP